MKLKTLAASAAALFAASPALAHTGVSAAHDLAHGFAHPLGGADHMLAMVSVGLFAARLGGKALYAVPAAFVAAMGVSGAIAMNGLTIPFVEAGIAASVLLLGALLALRVTLPVSAASALVAALALFHGYAHGAETPADASGLGYALGFLAATALLHAAGVAAGLGLAKAGKSVSTVAARTGGAAVAAAGMGLLAGWF